MEELPLQPNKSAAETDLPPADAEKIGDLLLRYELPSSEPIRAAPLAAEQAPKLIISRDNLRERIGRYKELKLTRSKQPGAEAKPVAVEQLTETHFERRHEIRDDTPSQAAEPTEPNQETPSSAAASVTVPPQMPPAVPPPFMPQKPKIRQAAKITNPQTFKKPLIFGLAAGTLTGVVLIILYLR